MKPTAPKYLPLFPYLGNRPGAIGAEGELIVVNFCGIGGSCEGLKNALNQPPTHAINHNPVAIGVHRVNLPHTHHHVQDVWQVDPAELAGKNRIAVAWFSPDCTHFSKAKGGKPKEQKIRDLALVTHRYSGLSESLKPRVIFLENVEEFMTWGPLDDAGYPIKEREGETFREFIATLESHGYTVEHNLLKACDYGAPTTRKRFFLIARCDGHAIKWPKPTHGNPNSEAVKEGRLLPWRTAAECIDWTIPAQSIFDRRDKKGRKRAALVPNTLRRISRGLQKFVKDCEEPFIAPITLTDAGTPFLTNKQFANPSRSLHAPMSTVTTNHNKQELVMPYLTPRFGLRDGQAPRIRAVTDPLATLTATTNNGTLAAALLVKSGHHSNLTGEGSHFRGQPVTRPISTITASGNHPLLLSAFIAKHRTGSTGSSLNEPVHTITSGGNPVRPGTGNAMSLVSGNLIHFYGMKKANEVRGQRLDTPLKTQTTENRHGLFMAGLVKHFGGNYQGRGINLHGPMHAVTTTDHHALLGAYIIKNDQLGFLKDNAVFRADKPISTITTKPTHKLVAANLVAYYGASTAANAGAPIGALTTKARYGLTLTTLVRQFGTSNAASIQAPIGTVVAQGGGKTHLLAAKVDLMPGGRARAVYDLMCRYAPECLTAKDHAHQFVFVSVRGEEYVIADVCMRMLVPRELARGQSFPDDYVLEYTADGTPVTVTDQVKGIGNSVPPVMAEALARANPPFPTLQEAAD